MLNIILKRDNMIYGILAVVAIFQYIGKNRNIETELNDDIIPCFDTVLDYHWIQLDELDTQIETAKESMNTKDDISHLRNKVARAKIEYLNSEKQRHKSEIDSMIEN
jgi:hypothetical protein